MQHMIRDLISGYLVLMSIIGFSLMGIDKRKAMNKAFRIPEKTLILAALLGGGVGSLLGMNLFRHKTKHIKFRVLFPLAAIFYIIVFLKVYTLV